ncbi:hypothetical protein N866_16595 [Actinotalea ferrariae CF5-4]|uniref:Uncharacterized protein n=1 Tax=Actinotalea ferrariae CF5-4 TaxID=948458 RepID=A0A021VSB0_9CELL|nr:hypothetical protein N866_16595 [Actinotalea ferrariae CF5-4]
MDVLRAVHGRQYPVVPDVLSEITARPPRANTQTRPRSSSATPTQPRITPACPNEPLFARPWAAASFDLLPRMIAGIAVKLQQTTPTMPRTRAQTPRLFFSVPGYIGPPALPP